MEKIIQQVCIVLVVGIRTLICVFVPIMVSGLFSEVVWADEVYIISHSIDHRLIVWVSVSLLDWDI